MFTSWQVKKTVLYILGVTNNLLKRVYEHKNDFVDGFTKKYQVHRLVYYEETNDINSVIMREKQVNYPVLPHGALGH
ncbi:MAG: GIY-YIG nuclease family protein [Candidatus Omnitrophota bacterium]